MSAPEPIAYSYASAAAVLDVSVDTIRAAVRSRDLPVRYVGTGRNTPRIAHKALTEWFESLPDNR